MTITIDENGIPRSSLYDDIYYSKQNGVEESRYVFLQNNQITHRWQTESDFVIGELGFGTGLNFLTTWHHWSHTDCRPQTLHFISIEKHPLKQHQLSLAHQHFPELEYYSKSLTRALPEPIPGIHRLWFEDHRISLTLCYMDIEDALHEIEATIDCWFLDGFSPHKNPAMWSQTVMDELAKRSHRNTTLSTFTAASIVQKHLRQAGFKITKIPGFAGKREMITARMETPKESQLEKPWFHIAPNPAHQKDATVIGAGIAGCQIAWHLAQRGWHVSLIERNAHPAQEASGNPIGIIAPKLSAQPGISETFYLQCFQYILNQFKRLNLESQTWSDCGVLQIAKDERSLNRWHALSQRDMCHTIHCLTAQEASHIANISINHPALYISQAGWINPSRLCQTLISHPLINLIDNTTVTNLHFDNDEWQYTTDQSPRTESTRTLVLACGKYTDFEVFNHLPTVPVAGQSSLIPANDSSRLLRTVIDHSGYITPSISNNHFLGASYLPGQDDITPSRDLDEQNLAKHIDILTRLFDKHDINTAHSAVRMTSPDRLPYVGPVPNAEYYTKHYQDLHHGKHWKDYANAKYHQGLYVSMAYASRGLMTSAYCAEMLASQINNEPSVVQKSIRYALHPARFMIKQYQQGNTVTATKTKTNKETGSNP